MSKHVWWNIQISTHMSKFQKQTLFWSDNSVEIRLISGMCYENILTLNLHFSDDYIEKRTYDSKITVWQYVVKHKS